MKTALTPEQQTMLATWHRLLATIPSDIELIPVSEIFGKDRLVEEMVIRFTHSPRMPWMLPGRLPTGHSAEFSLIVVMEFRNGKLASDHIYWDWDQARLLAQLLEMSAAGAGIGSANWLRRLVAQKSDGLPR
jgi:carboxymethylenebutenolidase